MVLDSIVNVAAGKIAELLIQEAKFLYRVEDQVRSLQGELRIMNGFLKNMEALDEEGGDECARYMIKEIRKIAYDAEDAVESYILEAEPLPNMSEKFFKRFSCFCISPLFTHQVGSEIEAIKERIAQTMEICKKYRVENGVVKDARDGLKTIGMRRPIAYSHHNEEHVVGFEEDIDMLVEMLIDDETQVKVVSIVGMGGSGKTTMARKLYNHESVKKHFDYVLWVSVSQTWVAQPILFYLLKKLIGGETIRTDMSSSSVQILTETVHKYLEMRSCLVVLDDVWEEKALQDILPALPLRSDGCKIIVTTRKQKVVDYPDLKPLTYPHRPRRLNEVESWELFGKIALIHRKGETNKSMDIAKLEALGKEMLTKCEGLPLAVIALAGILRDKETFEEWEKVKKAVSSRIMRDGRGTHLYGPVKEMLALSYNDLPCELKPCFLYLSLFTEEKEIKTKRIIQMWIAEGFITSDKLEEGDTLEDIAQRYLDELVHRCVVQIERRNIAGNVSAIRVHDLVRDLCIKKAKDQDFLELFASNSPNLNTRVTESRRMAIYAPDGMYLPFPATSQHLRSLVYGAVDEIKDDQNLSLGLIHENFRLLRVLVLEKIKTSDGKLPSGIGTLIHLRYLGLRMTNITELPSSMGNLRNLLTLDYKSVENLECVIKIPDVLWKIECLRHLYLPSSGYVTMEIDKLKLHTLKNLQTLWGLGGGSWMLEELPRLSPSVQKLSITGITNFKQLETAFQCPSIRFDHLHTLWLQWESASEEGHKDILLENLEPIIHCQHLRKLRLEGRIEDRLARIQFPTCIKKLILWKTEFEAEATLTNIGKLPNLIFLRLSRDAYKAIKWTCSAGEFSQLKHLHLYVLSNLEEWSIERGAMPQLKDLIISRCQKLSRVPEGLKFITSLEILHFQVPSDELYRRVKGEDDNAGEDAHIIQHVPIVKCFD